MVVGEASLLCGLATLMGARSHGPEGPHFLYCMKKGLLCSVLKNFPWMPWAGQCMSHWERGLLIGEAEPKRTQSCPIFQAPHPQHSAAGHRRARKTRVSVKNPVPALYAYFVISIAYMFPMGSMGL